MLLGCRASPRPSGRVPELVDHGGSGLIYHDSDAFALAAAVARLLDDPETPARSGRPHARWLRSRYDREAVAHSTADIYREVLAAAGTGRAAPTA